MRNTIISIMIALLLMPSSTSLLASEQEVVPNYIEVTPKQDVVLQYVEVTQKQESFYENEFRLDYDLKNEDEQRRFEEEERRFKEEEQRRFEEEERQFQEENGSSKEEERRFQEENRQFEEGALRFKEEEQRRFEEEERRFQEEERRQAEDEDRRFANMKRNLGRFTQNIDRMERELERTGKRILKCSLSLPTEIVNALSDARVLAKKVDTANTADELEDIMFELEEVSFFMEDWGHQMGPLNNICEMLTNAERELKRLVLDQERMQKKAEQLKINMALMFGKLRELTRKMEAVLVKARSLASTDPEGAIFLIEENVFFRMEEYHNAQRAIEMALDMSRGLKDASREILEFKDHIKELKERKKDTSLIESLVNKLEMIKKELEKRISQGDIDPDEIGDIIEESFDIREELMRLFSHLEGGKRFIEVGEFIEGGVTEEFSIDLPEGFRASARTRVIQEAVREGSTADLQIKEIKETASLLAENKLDAILAEVKQLRNQVKEQQDEIKYLRNLTQDFAEISTQMQEQLNTFISYGVDENSKNLGEGERAAVLHSYKAAFQELPEDERDLEDIIKIVNGRFPSQRSNVAEKQAKKIFRKIFKRVANMDNENDKAAIMVMAYGLRQVAENRKLESEQRGIAIFQDIFNALPSTTEEWNTMQAITYSGAVRKPDRDKDFLSDEDEEIFGTDPDNPDTDGDGIPDGDEVDEEFDPLKK